MSETAVAIASKLYESRRLLRRLLGNAYDKHAKRWMEVVNTVAEAEGAPHIKTCMKLMQDVQQRGDDDGMASLWLMAATVELIEPDENTPKLTEASE